MLADVLVHREELADPSPVPAQVERVQYSHLLSGELKVEHVQVGSDPGRVRGLGHCGDPSLGLRKRKKKKSSLEFLCRDTNCFLKLTIHLRMT